MYDDSSLMSIEYYFWSVGNDSDLNFQNRTKQIEAMSRCRRTYTQYSNMIHYHLYAIEVRNHKMNSFLFIEIERSSKLIQIKLRLIKTNFPIP